MRQFEALDTHFFCAFCCAAETLNFTLAWRAGLTQTDTKTRFGMKSAGQT